MKKTNQITTINTTDTTNTTNTNNTKGEITMKNTRTKKHSFKTRLIATALSAITILSVGAMSFSTASVTASAASIEETGKKIGIDATDAAFDTIADLFPGGKILLSPFQSLFHSGVDDKDPMEIIDEKLDQIDNKLDKLDEKLTELNQNINKNTEWMAQKVQNTSDMSELRAEFKGLSPQLAKFVKDVKAVETNKNLNKSQKIMRLAALTDTTRFDNITTYVYNIMKSMDGQDPAYVDMFKALYTKEALDSMFAREAYQAALPTEEALVTQYVSAVALIQECQTAVKAVSHFNENNIHDLNTTYDLNLYSNFDQYRHSFDDDDASLALMAAAIGAKNFKTKYDRPAFINKNANTSGRLISLKGEKGLQYPWSKDKKDYLDVENKVKNNALTTQELSAIVDHVRAKFPKNTMYEYLIFDMGIDYSNVSVNDYIILSDEISVSKTRNSKIDKSFNGIYNCKGYDIVGSHIGDETELTEEYNAQTVKPNFTRLYMDSVIYNEALKQHQAELLINEQAYQKGMISLDTKELCDSIVRNLRMDISSTEKSNYYSKYSRRLRLEIDDDGIMRIKVQEE